MTPFTFGRLAVIQNFTSRNKELERLVGNFSALTNTTLISPRRWGKSSLVRKAAQVAEERDKKVHVCFIDAFSVHTEEEFYQLLATEMLRISASKMELLVKNAKKFLGKFIPKVSFSADGISDVSLALDWHEVVKHPDDVLNMAESIAKEKNWKLVICVDEFQNVATFKNPLSFQKKLRASWQKHQHVAYCLYGSKRHMMLDVFTNASMPFYKFGDIMILEKIKVESWIGFIVGRFADTKKNIVESDAALIAELAECHPYYVQQLAQQSWLRTKRKCNSKIIHEAHESIVNQLSLLFQSNTEELTNTQVYFLQALLENVEKLSSKETLEKYKLGTSANVLRIKKTLENKEIIDIQAGKISILDPMYKSWLRTECFKMK